MFGWKATWKDGLEVGWDKSWKVGLEVGQLNRLSTKTVTKKQWPKNSDKKTVTLPIFLLWHMKSNLCSYSCLVSTSGNEIFESKKMFRIAEILKINPLQILAYVIWTQRTSGQTRVLPRVAQLLQSYRSRPSDR